MAVIWCLYQADATAAELRIFSPVVPEQGQVEVENNSSVTFDRSRQRDGQQTHFGEVGYGVTDFWRTELEGHWESDEDGLRLRTLDNENIVQLSSQRRSWIDFALFEEWDQAVDRRTPDVLTLGTLFQKRIGLSQTVVDVFLDRQFSRNAAPGTTLRYAGRSIWQVTPLVGPGVEFYGQPGRIGHFGDFDGQDHRLGPALAGELEIEGVGEVGYDIAYVFGLTPASPQGTVVWRVEFGRKF